MPDGTWHIFPINGNWGHCTSADLLSWNCSHPSTGWNMSNTGAISVTPAGYFAFQANNYNVSMARASDSTLNTWEHNLTHCGTFPGDRPGPNGTYIPIRVPICGVVANPTVPFPGTESLSDTGRALKLKSGWYLPVGVRGPKNAGGGVHWFKAKDETMTSLTEASFLFTVNVPNFTIHTRRVLECV